MSYDTIKDIEDRLVKINELLLRPMAQPFVDSLTREKRDLVRKRNALSFKSDE